MAPAARTGASWQDRAMPYTLVTFHAHPDDEAIATGGIMARAAAEGNRVVLVVATRGDLGEVDDGFLSPGETLADRRAVETERAADVLGVARVEFLGYTDSGMDGEPTNDAEGSFWSADIDEAAGRLAAILTEEHADVLTVYDDHGNYGHPDHVQVHRVGVRAAELAATPRVYESTLNRDHIQRLMAARPADLAVGDDAPDPSAFDEMGSPESEITTTVDVREYVEHKRAAMRAHASQISESSFFLTMPDEAFLEAFGWEWLIRRGERPAKPETSVFDGLGHG
jgi:LmbE family N-acetylglucosaminyl deacetylase